MAPITRAQKQKAIEDERDEFWRQLGDMTTQRDTALAQLEEMRSAYEQLRQENQSMVRQIEVLNQQLSAPLTAQSSSTGIALGGLVVLHAEPQCTQSTTQRTLHINQDLSSELLVLIFSYLPQNDVNQLARVCKSWNLCQKNVFDKVRSISLLVGHPVPYNESSFINPHLATIVNDDGTLSYPKYRLDGKRFNVHYKSVSSDTVGHITNNLLNIVSLRITINNVSFKVIDQVIKLIENWSSKLITLELWCAFSENDGKPLSNKLLQLLKVINSLPVLMHLTVELQHSLYRMTGAAVQRVDDQFRSMDVQSDFEMAILARLQEFNFAVWESIEHTPLFLLLDQFVPSNPQLTHIRLSTWNDAQTYMNMARLNPNVASRLTFVPSVRWARDLDFVNLGLGPQAVEPFFEQYASLTELCFCISSFSTKYSKIINMLSPLKQLIHLNVNVNLTAYTPGFDYTPKSLIAQLESVKMLSFCQFVDERSIGFSHWAWAFPNVQVIELSPQNMPRFHGKYINYCPALFKCPMIKHIYILEYRGEEGTQVWTEWTVLNVRPEVNILLPVLKE